LIVDPTAQVPLGRTGLTVPRLGLGSAPLAHGEVDNAGAVAAIAGALETAPMLVDTAPFYGLGLAEHRVGKGIAGRRSRVVISSKVGRLLRPDAAGVLAVQEDYSYDGAMRSLEDSLERLGVDRIDVVHIHDPDNNFELALSGAYKALDRLRAEGTIGAVSAGMNQWQMLSRFMDHADFDCFLLAGRYSLLDRSAEAEFLPKARAAGIGVIIGGVFNSGILADPRPGAWYDYKPASSDVLDHALKLQKACAAYGIPLKAAALQFPSRHPAVTTTLVGVHTAAQWAENVKLMNVAIPEELWESLASPHWVVRD
jgi:D-threo-aldose 1-dehydrogenase